LTEKDSHHSRVFSRLTELIKLRKGCEAFHPNATMFTLQLGDAVFGFLRKSIDRSQDIFAVFNVTDESVLFDIGDLNLTIDHVWMDLVSGTIFEAGEESVELEPYQFLWISNKQ
jgi:sucrose phosphorylase